jgi:sphinganine-1-phosphate aldolase
MEVVAPQSAHPCIDKAAELLNVRLVRVRTRAEFTADAAQMAAAITPKTVMLYCSFPSYAYGLVDDIAALGALAASRQLWLHVDACLSGLLAPFARMNGEVIPPFDFDIPGVSSLSADLHKHGYSAKGASLILFRDADLARFATFSYANHPLSPMTTATLAGTASGAPIASAWAVMQHLGVAGYRELAARLFASRRAMVAAINGVPGFAVLGQPLFSIVVVTSGIHELEKVRNALGRKRWFAAPVLDPPGMHLNIGALDGPLAEELARDLNEAAEMKS